MGGKLSGFSLLFEAFVLLLSREMSFTGVARITGSRFIGSWPCAIATSMPVGAADLREVRRLAIDETSRAKGQST
ncbi:MAG: transposase family protein [Steroidobacteraceae bacterium]